MEVVVEYEYEGLHDDELTLRPGDIIKHVRYIEEDGWMEGDLNGKRGLFPDNFVKELKQEAKEGKEPKLEPKEETSQPQRREKGTGNVANLVQRMSTIGILTGSFLPQPPASSKKPKKHQCKALFDYTPQNEDELELKVGDLIQITEEVEEGWWSGHLNGKTGLFPSNFVKALEPAGDDAETRDADETDAAGTESSTTPILQQPSSGTGAITQPKKIRGVGFGDIFSEGSVKLKARLPSPKMEERKDRSIPSLPSAAKPAHPINDSQRDGDAKPKEEFCRVTFAFEATNEDELSIKEGDIVHIISKDTGEPGWWRGDVAGKEGVFPDNFVLLLHETEKEMPSVRGSVKSSPKQDSEEKPKKPPPPSKLTASKPEVASADRKPHPIRPEERVDKFTSDHKSSKPAAPVVPPKKPAPPPGKARPGSLLSRRPDKPLGPSPNLRQNEEVPLPRPKSDLETALPNKPKSGSGDLEEKSMTDLMSFDELSCSSEKLSHLTANRPKMPGRRLPAQFGGGNSPSQEVNVEKSFSIDDDAKAKLTETRKLLTNTSSPSPSPLLVKSGSNPMETRSSGSDALSQSCSSALNKDLSTLSTTILPTPSSPSSLPTLTNLPNPSYTTSPFSPLDELRCQMREMLLSLELLKAQQTKEMAELRGELDDERQKRVALQAEIEKIKRSIRTT